MTRARKTFLWIFLILLGLGILVGLLKLVAPDAVHITINQEEKVGFEALAFAAGMGAGLGIFFGLIIARIVAIFGRKG